MGEEMPDIQKMPKECNDCEAIGKIKGD